MPYDDNKADFKAIAGNAKKSPAFKEMGGGSDDDGDEGPGDEGASEDRYLGEAFQAAQDGNESAFKEAMAAAMRECYRSMK